MSQIESLSQIEGKLNNLSILANENIKNANSDSELDQLRVSLLGKKGELSIILKTMGKLSSVDRPIIGQKANLIKINLQDLITKRKNQLISEAIDKQIEDEKIELENEKALLSSTLEFLGYKQNTVVVEVNDLIINSKKWESEILKEGDKLEVVSIVGGG